MSAKGTQQIVEPPPGPGPAIGRRHAMAVAGASAVGALSNFVVMFVVARAVAPDANAEFLVFWSLLTGMFGIVVGIQQETTRAVGVVEAEPRSARARILPPALAVGAAVALLLALALPPMAGVLVSRSATVAVPLLVVATLLQTCYVVLVGAFAGEGRWSHYAGILTLEVAVRMGLVVLVATLAPGFGLPAFEAAAAGGVLVLLGGLVVSPVARRAIAGRADQPPGRMVRNFGFAALSTSATALLITGFPAIMQATNPSADQVELAALILVVSLTRAPIMMPLTTFQGVAVKAFLLHRDHPFRAVAKPSALLLAMGLVGGVAAWVVGPWFLTLFSDQYRVEGWVFGALTLTSAFMATLTLLGTLALTIGAHRVFAAGWIITAATAIGALLADLSLTTKTVLALAVSPLVGCAAFVVMLLAVLRRPPGAPEPGH